MADANSAKVISTSENSSSNNSPHLAFTTISNIKLHIHVQLSLSEPNYKKWSRLFRLLILRFNLKGYIDGTTIASSADDAEWYQFDALIQGWILSTITDEVSDLVLANNVSAHALWMTIYNLFHDNKHARAMQLEHRFRTTVKGHLSINEYCRLLKNLSEYLDDVDAPVTEHALVLQVLQRLPHDIQGQVQFLQYQNPLPTFLEVRSTLLLVEQQQTDAVYGAGAPSLPSSTPAAAADTRAVDTSKTEAAAMANLGAAATAALVTDLVAAPADAAGTLTVAVEDKLTGAVIHRSNSDGPLYPILSQLLM
ncbi:unnamed protein product [Cuscuta campestris]|uniref:Retrotransposon Copia-like N-terminal domain-containing protein n=1 Tax=Cuscuta campestris TaxID=132261 RepID=A0A484NQ58_9ASTE|nr:unnamed protein product [Cuscuta campestris]